MKLDDLKKLIDIYTQLPTSEESLDELDEYITDILNTVKEARIRVLQLKMHGDK